MSRSILPPVAIEYPSGDGKPMAENDAQLAAMLYAIGALRVYYRDRSDVYVSGNLLIYYEEGNPRVSIAPWRTEAAALRAAESRAEREAALRRDEVAARRAAEARIAELEALLRGQNR